MKNKRNICILLIFLVFMITISAASAADDATSDLTSMDDNEEIILEDSPNEEIILSDESENLVLEDNDVNGDAVSQSNDEEPKLSESTGTFTDLENDINGNNDTEISLTKNYIFNPDSDSTYQNGINIKRAVTINGNGMTIDGNNLARAFHVGAKNVIMQNINFINCRLEDGSGAAVFWDANGGSISNCNFTNNTANAGAALMWYGSDGTISNCNFQNNTASNEKTSGGGAILCYGMNDSISNCTFENNHAKVGGAVHMYYSSGSITDSTFINNTARQTGGAIYTEEISGAVYGTENNHVSISNCTFEDNHADMDGGAIGMYYSANCSVSNSTFTRNTADDGGAIYVDGLFNNSVSDCNFTENEAEYSGGAIFWISDNGSISNSNFIDNEADEGGAIYWFTDNGLIADSNFTNNTATSKGGAIAGKGNAVNCNFTENKANIGGGAMEKGTATNCTFTKNSVDGTYSTGGAIENGNAINCNFINNTANSGGAMYEGNAINCNFINNTANSGGAMYEGNAINCNFTDNKAYRPTIVLPGENRSDAMYYGIAVNCNFTRNMNFNTQICDMAYLDTSDYESQYNSGETLRIELCAGDGYIDDISTKIIIYQNGEEIGTYYGPTGDGWEVSLMPGEYTATISIDELPEISSVNANLKITKASTEITTYDATFEFNTTRQYIVVTLRDGTGKTIRDAILTVQIDDTVKADMTDQNGEIRVSPRNLGIGPHTVTISFNENENYTGSSNSSIMTIIKSRILIECDEITAKYNSNDELLITLYDGEAKVVKGVTVTVNLNGEENYTTDNKGQIKVPTKELAIGSYTATIRFDGNENYTDSVTYVNVNIIQGSSAVTVSVKDIKYGENATAIVTLLTSDGNPITGTVNLTIKDQTKELTVSNGEGSVEFEGLNAGNYTLFANYYSNENYAGSSSLSYFNVERLASQIIYKDMTTTAVDVDTDGRVGEYFYITLTDSKGNALANKFVQIGFNGNVYNRTTDNDGKTRLQINLKNAGTYTFAVSFLGDENYNGSFIVAKIVVNKQKGSLTVPNKSYKASATTKALTATFKSASGKVVKGKKVTFTVNGKTYSATTNDKGVATVKVSLSKKGTYSFTAKFAGNNMYAAITKTAKLTLK